MLHTWLHMYACTLSQTPLWQAGKIVCFRTCGMYSHTVSHPTLQIIFSTRSPLPQLGLSSADVASQGFQCLEFCPYREVFAQP